MKNFIPFFILINCFLVSTQSYAQWNIIDTNEFWDYRDVRFLNDSIGFIVGAKQSSVSGGDLGVILKTVDAGLSWDTIPFATNAEKNAIFFSSDSTGFTCGNRFEKSTNGGNSWSQSINVATTSYIYDIQAMNDSLVYATGYNSHFYKTTNGGTSWTNTTLSPGISLNSLHFLNDSVGYLVGTASGALNRAIRKTVDYGNTWTNTLISCNLEAVFFTSDSIGYVCGWFNSAGQIYKTIDAGTTWNIQTVPAGIDYLKDITFPTTDTGYAVGAEVVVSGVLVEGRIVKTIDGGQNWVLQCTGAGDAFFSVHFTDPLNGYIVGSNGGILKTTNGGEGSNFPTINIGQDTSFCLGETITLNAEYPFSTYNWSTGSNTSSISINNSGIYYVDVTNNCGTIRDSIIINVSPTNTINQNQNICQGDSIYLGGAFQYSAGNYTDSLQSIFGCDSIVNTNLIVNPTNIINRNQSICQSDSIYLGGAFQYSTGNYTDSLQSIFGCDSVIVTFLSVDTVMNLLTSNDTTISQCDAIQLSVIGGLTYLWYPNLDIDCVNCANPIVSPSTTTTYTVTDLTNNCTPSKFVTITVDSEFEFFIPTVFTPNGDGINDGFNVYSDCIYSLKKQIYNRWGVLLFYSDQINEDWDGKTSTGKDVPEGQYFYIIEVGIYHSMQEKKETYKGAFSLFR